MEASYQRSEYFRLLVRVSDQKKVAMNENGQAHSQA
jgi:hypothetical protein